ncbi:MAG: hypothetical protein ACOC6B_06200 [Thermodesulfobacteriota bacterium]
MAKDKLLPYKCGTSAVGQPLVGCRLARDKPLPYGAAVSARDKPLPYGGVGPGGWNLRKRKRNPK